MIVANLESITFFLSCLVVPSCTFDERKNSRSVWVPSLTGFWTSKSAVRKLVKRPTCWSNMLNRRITEKSYQWIATEAARIKHHGMPSNLQFQKKHLFRALLVQKTYSKKSKFSRLFCSNTKYRTINRSPCVRVRWVQPLHPLNKPMRIVAKLQVFASW